MRLSRIASGSVALTIVLSACGPNGTLVVLSPVPSGAATSIPVVSAPPSVAGASRAPSAAAGSAAPTADPAEAYCTSHGGEVVERTAAWNTNGDPSNWLILAGHLRLCEFETGTGNEATRLAVDLVTLTSEEPTLAAIAYLSKIPTPQPPQVGQNPAEYDCTTALHGTSDFGNTAAGGGWVSTAEPVFTVMNLCVFADMSAIDEFGIWYYANGTVRGVDLAPILAYQPDGQLPGIYEQVRK